MFTEDLKEQTAELHSQAEQTAFMGQLFSGRLPVNKYLQYLMSLEKIYSVLEYKIRDNIDSEIVASIFDSKLERSYKISQDIKTIGTKFVLPKIVVDNINNYTNFIKESNETQLVAHHYIRYMGDISGGQILKTILEKSYAFTESQTSFYNFDLDIKSYRDKYKDNLNNIIIEETQKNDFINAVNNIYKITIKLLDSIMAP